MNPNTVEVRPISAGRVLILIKTGEVIQAVAALSIDRARQLYAALGETIYAIQNGQNDPQAYPDDEDDV